MSVVGIDGCPRGWIAIELGVRERPRAHFVESIAEIETTAAAAELIAVDMPIGFPRSYPKASETLARELLGAKATSVFLTPPREVLAASTYAEANVIAQATVGRKISRQSYALRHKIFQVDEWVRSTPVTVVEVHPEVSFLKMMGTPATSSKKTWVGASERTAALAAAGIHLDDIDVDVASRAGVDDVLDAAAAAWSARRVLEGSAVSLPAGVEPGDPRTRPAIWY